MKGVADATGLHVFFMAGGPIPRYGGALRTVQASSGGTADSVDPSAPLDFEPVDFDPMVGVTVDLTAASLLSLTTMDDDGVGEMPNYEDDEEEDDDEREGEDDDDDEEEDMLEKAREATRKREAQIAANKKLLASFGLGLDPITGKPVTAKPPPKRREPKAKPAVPVGRPATRASLSSAAGASAPATSTPPATATPSTPTPSTPPATSTPSTPPATSTPSTPPVTSTPSTAPTPPANPSPTPPPNLSTSPTAPVAGPAAMDVDVEEQDVVQDDDKMDVDDGLDPAITALKQAICDSCEKSVNGGWLLKGDDSKNASWLLNFVALARALVETEREYEYRNGLGRLATKSRPQQVADWIQNYRKATPTKCAVRNVTTFSTQWWAWWRANQPGWRTYDERGRPVRTAALPSGVKWEKLVEKEDGQPSQDWHEAVEEVTWVLGGLRMARGGSRG
ncbi:hypothetical protein C8F01DRAFT_1176387, partial [Mycena amicta]